MVFYTQLAKQQLENVAFMATNVMITNEYFMSIMVIVISLIVVLIRTKCALQVKLVHSAMNHSIK